MEKEITIKKGYETLDRLLGYLKEESSYECSKEYDVWDVRTDSNGQMEQCIVIKKGGMHGLKAYVYNDNKVNLSYIIPNKVLNAYFGKSQKRYRNILEIIAGFIKDSLLANGQKEAFKDIEKAFDRLLV